MKTKPKQDRAGELVKQLRSAAQAAADRKSMRSLADSADVDPSSLCRFLKGGGLTIDSADRLAAALGLRLSKR